MLRIRDIMTREVVSVSPGATLRDALELFFQHNISGAPVLDGEKIVGVVSVTDLLGFVATSQAEGRPEAAEGRAADRWDEMAGRRDDLQSEVPEGLEPAAAYFTELWSESGQDVEARLEEGPAAREDVLTEHTVDEVMSREIRSLSPGTDVRTAADCLRRWGVHRVLVAEDGVLFGILSAMDIAVAVADRRVTSTTYVVPTS